jgi:hypothetical protein
VSASLEVIVIECLHSLTPLLPSNLVLLAPGATYQLTTNRNNGKATYRSESQQVISSGFLYDLVIVSDRIRIRTNVFRMIDIFTPVFGNTGAALKNL